MGLKLTFACCTYDRMLALRTGDVRPEGIDLEFIAIEEVRETFDRMGWSAEFDLSEFSSSEYISRIGRGDRTFVALPVFPSRVFRHSFIFVNRRTVNTPKDLEGKRIGTALYTQTAAMWIRGHLAEAGVDLSSVTWVEGAVKEAGAHGTPNPPPLLRSVNIVPKDPKLTLDDMLDECAIDALIGTRVPVCYRRNPDVVRLFSDYRAVERAYYQRTRIHPIMHLVAVRRDVYEANPWIAASLYGAFVAARDLAYTHMHYEAAPRYMLPWLQGDIEDMHDVFGPNPWPYGVEANRPTLEALVRNMADQGYIKAPIPLEDLFVPLPQGHSA
jgi:4,5-dihydroxyphthalate decarboxylase